MILKMMTKSVGSGRYTFERSEVELEIPDFRNCNAEAVAHNKVRRNGTDSRLVFDSVTERVE